MKREIVTLVLVVGALSGNAIAAEKTVAQEKKTITCTSEGSGPVVWDQKDGGAVVVHKGHAGHEGNSNIVVQTDDNFGGHGGDVNVQVIRTNEGPDKKIVIVRRMAHDSADENKDGMITRREFMKKAETHFAALDENKDGVLSKAEAAPPMPPMPHIPDMPPIPAPPAPPSPPAPPAPAH